MDKALPDPGVAVAAGQDGATVTSGGPGGPIDRFATTGHRCELTAEQRRRQRPCRDRTGNDAQGGLLSSLPGRSGGVHPRHPGAEPGPCAEPRPAEPRRHGLPGGHGRNVGPTAGQIAWRVGQGIADGSCAASGIGLAERVASFRQTGRQGFVHSENVLPGVTADGSGPRGADPFRPRHDRRRGRAFRAVRETAGGVVR